MSFVRRVSIVIFVVLPFTVAAQDQQQTPVDPAAAVPAVGYESVFGNYQPMRDADTSPDKGWRAANDEMRVLGGHAGHMKNVPDQTKPAASASGAPPAEHGAHHMSTAK